MENVGDSLQGDEDQASKNLLFLLVGVGLNVHPSWPWQSEINRHNSSSRAAAQTNETGPAPSPPGFIRQLSNGASMGLWLSFAERNHQMNITTYLPFQMFMALRPSMGKAVQGAYPKRRHSSCHPFLHVTSFPFKSPVNYAI